MKILFTPIKVQQDSKNVLLGSCIWDINQITLNDGLGLNIFSNKSIPFGYQNFWTFTFLSL